MLGLLIAVASLVVEHRLEAHELQCLQHMGSVIAALKLQRVGSTVVVQGLRCPVAYGIFPDQGSTLRPRTGRQALVPCTAREVCAELGTAPTSH